MARSRIATGLEKLMSDLPKLMIQRSMAENSQMKKLSIAATEGYLKEAANYTSVAQFDAAAASMMDELTPHGNDPTIAMAGNNALKAMGRLRDNFVNKQEAVVSFNQSFAKAKELKLEDTTSGMQELYNSMMTTFEAKKQYFNSTEYSAYQKEIEALGDDIKTKSMFNYIDDLALGETDENGNIIVAPGIQSATTGLKNLYEMNKVGAISNKDAMKELFKISKDINAGNVGAILNYGTKDMRLLDRELKDFNYGELNDDYKKTLTSDFSALQFTEKEITPDNISYVRSSVGENITNVFNTGFIDLPKKKNGRSYSKNIDGLENFIKDKLKENPNQSVYDILEGNVDTWGYGLKPGDPDTATARNQRLHFSKMLDLYMKTGDIQDQILDAQSNTNVDSSISAYTNRLVNLAVDEQEPTAPVVPPATGTKMSTSPSPFIPSTTQPVGVLAPPKTVGGTPAGKQTAAGQSIMKGQSNILDLVKTIADKKRAEEFAQIPESEWDEVRKAPSTEPKSTFTMAKGVDVTDIIASIDPKPTSKPSKPAAVPDKGKLSLGKVLGGLAQDKSPEAVAKRAEAERVADIRVSVPSQSPDQDDMSYINSIDSKQLRKIGIWSDKNVTRKLKSSAKKELQETIKELQGMRGDADAAMVAKELPKLRRLLKEFNTAGVNKISKGMLEYMYALNASQYEGVDDFIASLSDGKIGVE